MGLLVEFPVRQTSGAQPRKQIIVAGHLERAPQPIVVEIPGVDDFGVPLHDNEYRPGGFKKAADIFC